MARARTPPKLLLALLYILICAAYVIQGSRTEVAALQNHQRVHGSSPSKGEQLKQGSEKNKNYARRLMIGSTAPTCTYNECRGCKYKCRAEQVPVEGNDPINSAYHYRCVCHR
ncbi:PREDICTED: EPIDERMAL PATTERNING FACTOR-like protein 9 [Fragaria vesca subsp. vesca]|uniref:EPIDERMAL PATTERNING FACTOR-like protein 9 n=1 Tax=Fragaria vesca subsp. vesca TaxID=101020 RepID=UPI0002C343EF|nr:PREDICTED: EPIDERMAL PATTERNING FACTOR-like protein 9 [Fragaria vesca subsp. vesca]